MNIWNQDLFINAWNFACRAHLGQCLSGSEIPYINHVGNVSMEAMAVVACQRPVAAPDLMIQCAVLHDVIEDTMETYRSVSEIFGKDVADGVMALTKDESIPDKNGRMADSLDRILMQPAEIGIVKMCDRIVNLQPPPAHWGKDKIRRYNKESEMILEALGSADVFTAGRLKRKISAYKRYC